MLVRVIGVVAIVTAYVSAIVLPVKRDGTSVLSAARIAAFEPYAGFATAAFCPPTKTIDWSCGKNCDINPAFIPTASGGDGGLTHSVVVGHQGTNTSNFLAVLVDANFVLTPLNSTLFPGLPSSILVHDGFENSHANSALTVLAAVKAAIARFDTTSVTVVGHSLGAALALLDGVFLQLHLSSEASVQTIGFGMPRVGNQEWADYVDAHLNVTHVNNKQDPIPVLPPIFLGYHHPSGEIHIEDSGAWVSCLGQDNPSPHCSHGDVANIFEWNATDHLGPYDGVIMGCRHSS
ncbi:lipase [Vararia minispora EC-137]|uniref:Lipase n=1 Tax=Vararia minispora EC-137 TaxID=1314806 RepID=A0ACB8Q853_9AGAM|nr:lipase [Vararia minispora EC-137]